MVTGLGLTLGAFLTGWKTHGYASFIGRLKHEEESAQVTGLFISAGFSITEPLKADVSHANISASLVRLLLIELAS